MSQPIEALDVNITNIKNGDSILLRVNKNTLIGKIRPHIAQREGARHVRLYLDGECIEDDTLPCSILAIGNITFEGI